MIDRMATLRNGFRVTRACGPDNLYELSIKFQSLEDLDTAAQELRAALDREEIDGKPLAGAALSQTMQPQAGPDWNNRRTDSLAGWINELSTLADHRESMPGFVRSAMKRIAQGLTDHAPQAAPPSTKGREYPPLPQHLHTAGYLAKSPALYTTDQMRAYVDADRAMLKAAPSAAQPGEAKHYRDAAERALLALEVYMKLPSDRWPGPPTTAVLSLRAALNGMQPVERKDGLGIGAQQDGKEPT